MSAKPIEFACTRPRSINLSLTQRSRKRSVARATAGVPAGPMRDCASRRSFFKTSVRRVVELDRRSGVDDDVARAELVASRVGERESVTTEIDLQHGQLFFRERRESSVAQLFLEALESRARQHLAL